jgi:hypothetical protein
MPKKESFVVYSAMTGDIDIPRTDIPTFSEYDRFKKPVLNAKIYKVLTHLFFDVEYSIYLDGNIKLKCEPEDLLAKLEKDIAVFPNAYHTCLYEEAAYCMFHSLDDPKVIAEQVARYRAEKFPANQGLGSCGIIVRRHTPEINSLCEKWWAEICRGSTRDQISFPYVFRDKIQYFERLDPTFRNNKYFIRTGHADNSKRIFRKDIDTKVR